MFLRGTKDPVNRGLAGRNIKDLKTEILVGFADPLDQRPVHTGPGGYTFLKRGRQGEYPFGNGVP